MAPLSAYGRCTVAELHENVSTAQRLELAVQTKSPTRLAQTFAAFVGQFYERSAFDALARQVNDLYAAEHADQAYAFRARLDRRLYDRYHAPVVWEVAPVQTSLPDCYESYPDEESNACSAG